MGMRKINPESPKEAWGESPMDAKSVDKKTIFPHANFDNKTLPEAKDWKVGKVYRVTLDLRMTGQSNRTGSDGVERGNYDFDVVGADTSAGEQKDAGKRYTS